jgi:hypothetical protein
MLGGGHPAHPDQPFPMDAPVNQRHKPQQAGQMWMGLAEFGQRGMRRERDPAGRQRQNTMVHLMEQKAVEVDEVPRRVDRGKLPGTALEYPVSGGKAADQQSALVGPAAFSDKIGASFGQRGAFYEAVESLHFLSRDIVPGPKFEKKAIRQLQVCTHMQLTACAITRIFQGRAAQATTQCLSRVAAARALFPPEMSARADTTGVRDPEFPHKKTKRHRHARGA